MEIAMEVRSEWAGWTGTPPEPWLTATFTFVALSNNKPAHINQLQPQTQLEKASFQKAAESAKQKRRGRMAMEAALKKGRVVSSRNAKQHVRWTPH